MKSRLRSQVGKVLQGADRQSKFDELLDDCGGTFRAIKIAHCSSPSLCTLYNITTIDATKAVVRQSATQQLYHIHRAEIQNPVQDQIVQQHGLESSDQTPTGLRRLPQRITNSYAKSGVTYV